MLVFEVLLNATSMFNHGNVRVPSPLEQRLRRFVVTPDMHRVHHSIEPRETNSNFGFNLPWWDRLFGTYRAEPHAGHEAMTIGIAQFRSPRELNLDRMLLQPFRADDGANSGPCPSGREMTKGANERLGNWIDDCHATGLSRLQRHYAGRP